jgi:hypothetical protein
MKWISVNDSMPTDYHHMVLTVDMNDKFNPVCLGKWLGDFWWLESQIEDVKGKMKPTHWMELPPLPNE